MGNKNEYDFSGYLTKYNVTCTDGKTIQPGAFADEHGKRVPLVWHHLTSEPGNILGYADLEARNDGIYARCSFNNNAKAKEAKEAVLHGDIRSMSVHANHLTVNGKNVAKGNIVEASLVTSGANKKATIDSISIAHADGSYSELEDEAIIHMGSEVEFPDGSNQQDSSSVQHAEQPSVSEVYQSLTDDQKALLVMVAEAVAKGEIKHSEEEMEDITMKKNVFESGAGELKAVSQVIELKHEDVEAIFADAEKCGSFKAAVLAHADEIKATYGIENLEVLFPDAKNITNEPELIKRDTEWVRAVMSGSRHTPFSRIKTTTIDLTADSARAKGYAKKGKKKVEEVIVAARRVTSPTTVYKKQKMDHDDIKDITDFNVVSLLWREMRMMWDEEVARAALIGDGRSVTDDDKIDENCIRPIYTDDSLYTIRYTVTSEKPAEIIDEAVRAQEDYEGSGRPTMFITPSLLTELMLVRDLNQRRIYGSETELASAMRVSGFEEVPVMKGVTRTGDDGKTYELLGIIVNMRDYTFGADRGGEVERFEDFDIDYNQHKYLLESRCSGALWRVKSAVVLERVVTTSTLSTQNLKSQAV